MWYILTWPFRVIGDLLGVIFRLVGGLIGAIFGVLGGVLGFLFSGLTFILVAILIVAVIRWVIRKTH